MLVELDEVIKCLRKAEDQWYRDKKDYKEHTRYDNSPDADYFGDTLKKRRSVIIVFMTRVVRVKNL